MYNIIDVRTTDFKLHFSLRIYRMKKWEETGEMGTNNTEMQL